MGIGVSIFLIAVGAVLAWAVEIATPGIDMDVVGVILMVVGALGLILSLLYREEQWPFGSVTRVVDREVVDRVDDGPPRAGTVRERRTVRSRRRSV